MRQITIHEQAYEYYSWEILGKSIFELAKQIIASGQHFDRIIALAKGGLTFSRSLVDYLDVKDVSSIQIEFYTGIGTTHNTPVITQSLPVSIKNQSILIFDDIVDKGVTMKLATEYLGYHGATTIKTAALVKKPWSTFPVDYASHSSEAWVIFPNESRETIQTLEKIWRQKGDDEAVIRRQLLEIGFTQDEVALFSNLK